MAATRFRALIPRVQAALGPVEAPVRQAWRRWKNLTNYAYDKRRFVRNSSVLRGDWDEETLSSLITIDYHRVEKGLALPQPRQGFGRTVVKRLIDLSTRYEARYGTGPAVEAARGALVEYLAAGHVTEGEPLHARITTFLKGADSPTATVPMRRAETLAATDIDFEAFVKTRRSVRQFTGQPVNPAEVRRAVALAQESPSVCNRQACRVHAIFGREDMARALSYQNGNNGFGNVVGVVLIVTADLRCFNLTGERNQGFVDGALFAMSLNYALHSLGYGTCMLNWSSDADVDRAMRADLGIPDHEVVITYMAAGHLPETYSVARSVRRDTDAVLRVLGDTTEADQAPPTREVG